MWSRSSIERQFPLFVVGLLATGILTMAGLAYVELGRFALRTTGERLHERSRTWMDLFAQAAPKRLGQLKKAVVNPAVIAVLRSERGSEHPDAVAALRRLSINTTSAMEIRDAQDQLLLTSAPDSSVLPPPLPGAPDSVSAFYEILGHGVFYDIRVTIPVDDGPGGSLVERRLVNVDEKTRKSLTGFFLDAGAKLLLGNASGDLWTDLGEILPGPPNETLARSTDGASEYDRDGSARLGSFFPVPATPWMVGMEVDRADVLTPVRKTLLRLVAIASGLLVVGAGIAWFLSRKLTRPLRDLTIAAGAIAAGDVNRRAVITRRDEIGRLGVAFNVMADRVEEARQDLEAKVEDRTREIKDALSALRREVTEKELAQAEVSDLNTKLSRQLVELAEVNAELDSFSYSVSHDLRAPLRAMAGFSSILLDDHAGQLDGDARRCAEVIKLNAGRMGALIDDLLHFSRLSRQTITAENVKLEYLAAEVWDSLEPERLGRDVRFTCRDLPECVGDRNLLRQVLVNLMGNALKYSRQRTPSIIDVTCRSVDGEWICTIKDNGVGFDMRYAEKLFGVFQRLHRSEDFEGTGVGLALVQRILKRHGFRIWAESAPGEGASFHFSVGKVLND